MLLYRFWIGRARQRIIGLDIVVKGEIKHDNSCDSTDPIIRKIA